MERKFKTKTEYLDFVENKFVECFKDKGYIEEKAVAITSQIDPTVDFVGSKISALKHYIFEDNISRQGRFLIQNCIKLKYMQNLKNNDPQRFGSYYKGMGTLTEYNLNKIVTDTFDYFLSPKYLGMDSKNLCIRISSKDIDLLESIENVDKNVRRDIDTVEEKHYRHKYGMDEHQIYGRDFNIGIRKGNSDEFFNCATLVVMEKPQKKIAVDMGIGNCSLSMCKFNTNNTVASSRMGDIIHIDSVEMMKFADSLIVISTLLKEDITEHSSKHFKKKFRQYLQALRFWRDKLNVSDEQILEYMNKFLSVEYKEQYVISEKKLSKILNNKGE